MNLLNVKYLGVDYRERYAELIKTKYYLNWVYNPKNGYPYYIGTTPLLAFLDAHGSKTTHIKK
jgi:hypothetical protein